MNRTSTIFAILLVMSSASFASCHVDGNSTQTVSLSVGGKSLERWSPESGKIFRSRLPGGFDLGIQIDPTSPEKYRELLAKIKGIDELVKISLFDMSGASPKLLSTTWGGANSQQGFGSLGGANRVELKDDQIVLWFHKPRCITLESLATPLT